jgi:ubiquinone/menaquinone biosynthesis C-methylase UbiE
LHFVISLAARDQRTPDLGIMAMAFTFKIRDFFKPRRDILKEVGIEEGFHILDYGCGPGSYVKPTADLVGRAGKIYALDINPTAIQMVKKIAEKNQLTNVETILSDCKTRLPSGSIDVVMLYDTFHHLTDQDAVLTELHRVLKPNGVLSFSDHHLREDEIISKVTNKGLFKLLKKGENTHSFVKKEA